MIFHTTRLISFLSMVLLLAACSKNEPTHIEKVCISEGTSVAECHCMANSIQSVLPEEKYKDLESRAEERGAQGLAIAMMDLTDVEKHSIGTALGENCASGNDVNSSEVDALEEPKETMQHTLVSACQVGGNTKSMCMCWAKHLENNLSTEIFNRLKAAAQTGGNTGLSEEVYKLDSEVQMSVGVVLMEAGQVCATAE